MCFSAKRKIQVLFGNDKKSLSLCHKIFYRPYSILFIIIQHELFIADSHLKCKQSLICGRLRTS